MANYGPRHGVKSIEELKQVFQEQIDDVKKESALGISAAGISASPFIRYIETKDASATPNLSASHRPGKGTFPHSSSAIPPTFKSLSSFIDVSKTLALSLPEIEYLWQLRHAYAPRSLCATIPFHTYRRMEANARKHPQFILPVPRKSGGAAIHFLQWTFPSPNITTVLFTHLAEYKLRGEFAQPHTTVTHHLDLAATKNLILLEGTVTDKSRMAAENGSWLLICLQKFYGGVGEDASKRQKLLEQFSQGDGEFKVEQLVTEVEKFI